MGARDLMAELAAAGVSVVAEGDRLVVSPASMLTEAQRTALLAAKPNLLELLRAGMRATHDACPAGWTGADMSAFLARRARLLWWRWAKPDASSMAARLVERDREGDDRISCAECRNYRPGQCLAYREAGLGGQSIGSDLVLRLQRCPAFVGVPE